MFSKFSTSGVLLGLLASFQLAHAHTWIEQLTAIAPNGTFFGPTGYPRGNVLRSSPGFSDPEMVYRLINIGPQDLMCKSSQTSQTQTEGSPRLQAPPGAAIALRYQENGHVTLPEAQAGKPSNRGTNYVYGTKTTSPDDALLAIHRIWSPDGKGGDGRGALLSTQNFDDGRCYQVNGGSISTQRQQQFKHTASPMMGADLWCQQDIAIPSDLTPGSTYTLYWVWDWPSMTSGVQEIYTTCIDIDIVESSSSSIKPVSKATVNYQQGQDLNYAAIPDQMADITNPTAVTGEFILFTNAPAPSSIAVAADSVLTTSSTGQSIAFSASASGPASGQAATESASAQLPGATEDPNFLSVHTTSTPGAAGLETQTFSIIPIGGASPTTVPGESAAGGAPQQTGGFRGQGGNRFSGFDNIGDATNIGAVVPEPTRSGMVVITEYIATAYETEWVTIMETQFNKREPAPTASEAHPVYQLRARTPFPV